MSEQAPQTGDLGGEAATPKWRGFTHADLEARADMRGIDPNIWLATFRGNDHGLADFTHQLESLCNMFGVDHSNWWRYVRSASSNRFEERSISPEAITKMADSRDIGTFLREWCWNVMPIEESDDVNDTDSSVALTLQLAPNLQVNIERLASVWSQLRYTDPDTGEKYLENNEDEQIDRLKEEGKDTICESIIDYDMDFTARFSKIKQPTPQAAEASEQ